MWGFLASGTLYLLGVAAILLYKPSSMFTPDGNWKEFGIGKNQDRYTAFPFWLFCITWAIVSYTIVEIITMLTIVDEEPELNIGSAFNTKRGNGNGNGNGKGNGKGKRNQSNLNMNTNLDTGETIELPKGYYVLNEKATQLSGMPKYIYLGPEN